MRKPLICGPPTFELATFVGFVVKFVLQLGFFFYRSSLETSGRQKIENVSEGAKKDLRSETKRI